MNSLLKKKTFYNSDNEIIPYDGSPMTWRVSVYTVVIENQQILIAKNRLEKFHDVLGGGVEFGETIHETLHREAMEEGGAKIEVGKLLRVHEDYFYHRKGSFHQTVQLFYEGKLVGELGKPTEELVEWVGFVDLKKIGTEYRLPTIVEKIVSDL